MLLPAKAEGSGHRHCAVPGMEGAVPAMIESCISVASGIKGAVKEEEPVRLCVRESVCVSSP